MLNCFELSVVDFFSVTPFASVNNAIFRDLSASFLFHTVFKISVNKKFGYENFRTKSLPEFKLVLILTSVIKQSDYDFQLPQLNIKYL